AAAAGQREGGPPDAPPQAQQEQQAGTPHASSASPATMPAPAAPDTHQLATPAAAAPQETAVQPATAALAGGGMDAVTAPDAEVTKLAANAAAAVSAAPEAGAAPITRDTAPAALSPPSVPTQSRVTSAATASTACVPPLRPGLPALRGMPSAAPAPVETPAGEGDAPPAAATHAVPRDTEQWRRSQMHVHADGKDVDIWIRDQALQGPRASGVLNRVAGELAAMGLQLRDATVNGKPGARIRADGYAEIEQRTAHDEAVVSAAEARHAR
ncbi:MAG TPA: hypothetical protein VIT92_12380, partial [Burkholderiaceae bacterium]